MALLASVALLSGCGKKDGATVYLTREISPESLVRIYEALGVPATGRVAVKMSTGEGSNPNYLKPELIGALIDGVNADPEDARKLARLLKGYNCHVNLIALNSVKERSLYGANERQIARFIEILESNGISATRRRTMGDDIEGACGQLRKKRLEENG
jgi:hypothetical protein